MDPQSEAEHLLERVLSANSPQLVSSALSSTVSYLQRHPPDQSRPFYSLVLPALLSNLFFSTSPSPWLLLPTLRPILSALLSPSGPLLSSLLHADRLSLLHFSFPPERLPLSLQPRLLRLFHYYLFWFAYFPICAASSPSSHRLPTPSRRHSWTSALCRRTPRKDPPSDLYLRLLHAYLRAFVPLSASAIPLNSDPDAFTRAEFVVNTFVHFWLVDNDFSPVSLGLRQQSLTKLPREAPPTPGLGEVVELLVKYVNSGLIGPAEEGGRMDSCLGPRWGGIRSQNLAREWNSMMQRPLYRYIVRSFLFCPMGASISNASQVFAVWMCYLEPWRISPEDFKELGLPEDQEADGGGRKDQLSVQLGKEKCGSELGYGPVWTGYVTSNYLFYSSLVVHFFGFAHKFLHINVEEILRMTSKLLCILTSSRQLLDLLKEIDAAYNSKSAGTSSVIFNSSYKYVPPIREQLQDWEDGLCENESDGSFLHENWNRDLKLFSENEDGAHQLLELLILRADLELQAAYVDNEAQSFQNLECLRRQMNTLFGGPRRRSLSPVPSKTSTQVKWRGDVFTPNRPGTGKHKWADSKYQGDWMRRPISESEVAWLARHLIRVSDWLNELLGLNSNVDDHTGPTYLEVPSLDLETVWGAKEVFWILLSFFRSCIVMLGHAVVRSMKRLGWRINLRFLASKKIMTALLVFTLVSAMRKAF